MHELAHASHWELRKGEWDNGNTEDKLQESWAMGVANQLTKLRYPAHSTWENISFNWMRDPAGGAGQYTTLIFDLIDNENQGLFNMNLPLDNVSGYTIAQIEAVLGNSNNIANLRDNLRNSYDNPSEPFLDELFTQYINLQR